MKDSETVPEIDWKNLTAQLQDTDATIALFGQIGMIPSLGFTMLAVGKVPFPMWVGVMLGLGVAVLLYAIARLFSRYDVIEASVKEGQSYKLHDGRCARFIGWDGRYLKFALPDGTFAEFHVYAVAKGLEEGLFAEVGEKDGDLLSISDVLRKVSVQIDRHFASLALSVLLVTAGTVCMSLNSQNPNVALLAVGCFLFAIAAGFLWSAVTGVWNTYKSAKYTLVAREWSVNGSRLQFAGLSLFLSQLKMKDKDGNVMKLRFQNEQAIIC